jgi:hypothetical protein
VKIKAFQTIVFLFSIGTVFSQKNSQVFAKDSIAPVGIIKNISDSALLDIVQRQTFRYFWHGAHPASGMARERDNTVKAEYYWDFGNRSCCKSRMDRQGYCIEAAD